MLNLSLKELKAIAKIRGIKGDKSMRSYFVKTSRKK